MTTQASQAVDTATRVAAGATRSRYDGVSIALHWTIVALVLIQFVLAETWTWFARPTRHEMVMFHMSFGILLTAAVIGRIVWRLWPGHAVAAAVQGWTEHLSKGVHYALYTLLVLQAVSGFVLRWSGKESMSFFGLEIPPIIPPVSRPVHHQIGDFHHWLGWTIVILGAGHALAALYHHVVLKDRVLTRMLPSGRKA